MLSKTAEYALRVAVWLAQSIPQPKSADQLARVTRIPRRYLYKVVQDLVRAGLARSQSGPGGGYVFNQPPEKTTILDVINAVAPLERITHCPLGLPSHTRLCPLHKELDNAFAATERALARVTLVQLLRSKSPIVPLCEARQSPGMLQLPQACNVHATSMEIVPRSNAAKNRKRLKKC